MKKKFISCTLPLFVFLGLTVHEAQAQLGFCTGNSGDPIFTETFGTGTTDGPALAPGTTTYNFTTNTPFDGSYTVSSTTNYFDWHDAQDHTANDSNGKLLIVNASFEADQFYRTTITDLCENTTYEFSAWVLNMARNTSICDDGARPIPINVRFQIWDDTDTNLLASGDTGNIFGTASPVWDQYGLVFKTLPGQTSVILKMLNNGDGGCGNDLGIDDISFKTCGDFVSLTNTQDQTFIASCEDQGAISTTLTATPDFSIFNSHAYQWQESTDGTNWVDILGETADSYTTPLLTNSTFYRVKIAEDAINISNSLCNIISDIFDILIVPQPNAPTSNGTVEICSGEMRALTVSVPNSIEVNWYDAPVNGNLLLENSTTFNTQIAGTYYAEATSSITDCRSLNRIAVSLVVNTLPVVNDENLIFCADETIILSAGIDEDSYAWSTGQTTKEIEVDIPGTYTVTVTNSSDCSSVKTIVLEQIDLPIIDRIVSDNENIAVLTENNGEFEYALNNGPYQDSPVFELVEGGLYMVNVRGKNNCRVVSQEFRHFVIPKFFTPNGDSFNDTFSPQGLEFFNSVEINIFDRFGKLLINSNSTSFSWNGVFNNNRLPSTDYWYRITVDQMEFTGHFALKR